MVSLWPHSRVRRTCSRFNRVAPACQQLRIDMGLDETLMLLSRNRRIAWVLNEERGGWFECAGPPVSTGKGFTAAAAHGEEVMACVDSAVFAFSPKFNTWRWLPKPFEADACHRLAKFDEKLVVAGGSDSSRLAVFDGFRWSPLPAHPGDPLESYALGTIDATIYVGKGLNHVTKVPSKRLYAYDTVARAWTSTWAECEKCTTRQSCGSAVVAGRLYSIDEYGDSTTVEVYDPDDDSCTGASMKLPQLGRLKHANTQAIPSICEYNKKLLLIIRSALKSPAVLLCNVDEAPSAARGRYYSSLGIPKAWRSTLIATAANPRI